MRSCRPTTSASTDRATSSCWRRKSWKQNWQTVSLWVESCNNPKEKLPCWVQPTIMVWSGGKCCSVVNEISTLEHVDTESCSCELLVDLVLVKGIPDMIKDVYLSDGMMLILWNAVEIKILWCCAAVICLGGLLSTNPTVPFISCTAHQLSVFWKFEVFISLVLSVRIRCTENPFGQRN